MYPLSNQAARRLVGTGTSAGVSTTPEELHPVESPSNHWAFLSLWHNCTVQHSVEKVELRHLTVDRQGLLELVVHVHRDINRRSTAQYLYTALGWR